MIYFLSPRVSTTELLAEIRNQQTKGLENLVMVFRELLHQGQRRGLGLLNAVTLRDSHSGGSSFKKIQVTTSFTLGWTAASNSA